MPVNKISSIKSSNNHLEEKIVRSPFTITQMIIKRHYLVVHSGFGDREKVRSNLVWLVWHEQQAHMAHINKHKTTVNIGLFTCSPSPSLTSLICVCAHEQTAFQENAFQPAEDACTSRPFPPRKNQTNISQLLCLFPADGETQSSWALWFFVYHEENQMYERSGLSWQGNWSTTHNDMLVTHCPQRGQTIVVVCAHPTFKNAPIHYEIKEKL